MLNHHPDGRNINVNCGSTSPESLQKFVVENHLDAGFAFDGDADRCMMVDEKGRLIDGDGIMYIIAIHMKEDGKLSKDTVTATVMSNIGFVKALDNHGIRVSTTDVGDKYVARDMFDNGYSIGGEQSGHIILGDFAKTGDGILTAIILTDILVGTKNIASALTAGLKILPQKLKNIRADDKNAIMANTQLADYVNHRNEELSGSGRILLRASGTEPMIRIMAEGETEELCEAYIAEVEDAIGKYCG